MLDDYNQNGKYTSQKELRYYGHDLNVLINLVKGRVGFASGLHEVHSRVMELLTDFAKSSRYSNIDFITNNHDNDPMRAWHNEIDKRIYSEILNDRQRVAIDEKCSLYRDIGDALPSFVMGYYDENRKPIKSPGELNYLLKRSEMLSGYRVLLVIQIIEFLYKSLDLMASQSKDRHFHFLELGRFFATIIYGTDKDKVARKDFNRM
ncbi:hypothetical protein CKF43_13750 [Pantoea graminicola]|nr:hypothetical protein CKF43_13750 [Pantoea sp. ARC607]